VKNEIEIAFENSDFLPAYWYTNLHKWF